MSDAPELLPCPFCGDAKSPRVMWVDWRYRVVCLPPSPPEFSDMPNAECWPDTGCGGYGAGDEDEAHAIAAWNRRAALSDHPAVKQLVAEAEAMGMERAAKACDRRAGNASDFDRYTRRAAGMCAADIRAEAAAIRGETT